MHLATNFPRHGINRRKRQCAALGRIKLLRAEFDRVEESQNKAGRPTAEKERPKESDNTEGLTGTCLDLSILTNILSIVPSMPNSHFSGLCSFPLWRLPLAIACLNLQFVLQGTKERRANRKVAVRLSTNARHSTNVSKKRSPNGDEMKLETLADRKIVKELEGAT